VDKALVKTKNGTMPQLNNIVAHTKTCHFNLQYLIQTYLTLKGGLGQLGSGLAKILR